MNAVQLVLFIFAILGGLGGLILVFNFLETTLFKKAYAKRRLAKLAPSTTINFFNSILGSPTFVNDGGETKQYVFVDDLFYVTAVTDLSDKVLAYSVTTRRKDFHPSFTLGPYSITREMVVIKLGKSTFSEINKLGDYSGRVSSGLGARRSFYSEEYYFGNPGRYQTYLFCVNDAGFTRMGDPQVLNIGATTTSDPQIQRFRKSTIINTYTITAPHLTSDTLRSKGVSWIGPDLDQVRILN
jgi:hypothetical protein